MSGHSKWAQIKRQKGVADQKKGQLFSKLARAITIAVKEGGGGDPASNFKLRVVIDKAKALSMPNDNIERAIVRATGEGAEGQLEEVIYEGYGPFGAAFLIEAATDNKNRTSNSLKQIFSKHRGNLGSQGSVAWQFVTRGQILVPFSPSPPREGEMKEGGEDIELLAIDLGAEDARVSAEGLEIYCAPLDLEKIKKGFLEKNIPVAHAAIIKESTQGVDLTAEQKKQVEALLSELENDDDVIAVHTSANL